MEKYQLWGKITIGKQGLDIGWLIHFLSISLNRLTQQSLPKPQLHKYVRSEHRLPEIERKLSTQ